MSNISAVVVLTRPDRLNEVLDRLKKIDRLEPRFTSTDGKIVVLIEGADVSEEIATLRKVETIDGVLSAQMVYSYSEGELDRDFERLAGSAPDLESLSEGGSAEGTGYGADIKRYFAPERQSDRSGDSDGDGADRY